MGAQRTIDLLGLGLQKEALAGGIITPGHLLQREANGNVVVHATAAGNQGRLVAVEDGLQGRTIADDYASGETTQFRVMPPGSEANMLSSAAIAQGAYVESAGDGRVRPLSSSAATSEAQRHSVIGVAQETTGGADERVIVEFV